MRYFYLLLFCTTLVNAQKTPTFPRNQHSYLGGVEGFYKDFQKILLAKNLQPCANKQELFLAEIIIKGDGSVSLSDSDQSPDENNKCAKSLTQEVIKDMSGWIPATIDGEVKTAGTSYAIFPAAFFGNFKDGYSAYKFSEPAKFKEGMQDFRYEVMKRVDPERFYTKGSGPVVVHVRFVVNEEGKMEDIKLDKSSGLKEYDEMILHSVRSVKKNWTPPKIHGIPTKYRFVLPFSFRTD